MTREEIIDKVAQYWVDSADLDALMNAYYDNSVDYLESLTDNEFESELKDYCISFDKEGKLIQG
jgi:hypothetical protein